MRESDRVKVLDKLNALSQAAHHAARVLENLRYLREKLPSQGFEDVLRDVDEQVAKSQKLSAFIADSVAMTARDFVALAKP